MNVFLSFQVGICVPWLIESEEVFHLDIKLRLGLFQLINELVHFTFLDLTIVP